MPISYTKKEIAYNLNCSERTIEEDHKFLKITPQTKPGRANLYSNRDYQLICQMREHMAIEGNTRDTFASKVISEIVTQDEGKVIRCPSAIAGNSIAQEIKLMATNDPFFTLEIMDRLQKIADNNWSVPTAFMAALLQITPSTLLKYQQYSYNSFVIIIADSPVRKPRTNTLVPNAAGLIKTKIILWRVEAKNE